MANIPHIIRPDRLRVPRPPLEINWENPIAKGLQFCIIAVGPDIYDLVTGARATVTNSGTTERWFDILSEGPAYRLKNTSQGGALQFAHNSAWDFLGETFTLWWRGALVDNVTRNLISKTSGGGGTNSPFDFRTDASGRLYLVHSNAGGNGQYERTTAIPLNTPRTTLSVVGFGASIQTTAKMYYNGAAESVSNPTGTGSGAATSTGTPLRIGIREDGNCQSDAIFTAAMGWNRELSAAEQIYHYLDPWSLVLSKDLLHSSALIAAVRRPVGRVWQ